MESTLDIFFVSNKMPLVRATSEKAWPDPTARTVSFFSLASLTTLPRSCSDFTCLIETGWHTWFLMQFFHVLRNTFAACKTALGSFERMVFIKFFCGLRNALAASRTAFESFE